MPLYGCNIQCFEDKIGPGYHDDGLHEDPGQALTQVPLGVQRGYVGLYSVK
jgi:hypothetical protein